MTNSHPQSVSLAVLVAAYLEADRKAAALSREVDRLECAIRDQIGAPRPLGRSRQAALWDARRLSLAADLGLTQVEADLNAALADFQRLKEAITTSRATTPADLAAKAEIVALWCDPDPLLASLVADARRLAAAA